VGKVGGGDEKETSKDDDKEEKNDKKPAKAEEGDEPPKESAKIQLRSSSKKPKSKAHSKLVNKGHSDNAWDTLVDSLSDDDDFI
jgi:hypothetical protein